MVTKPVAGVGGWTVQTVLCVLTLVVVACGGAHAALLNESAIGPEAGLNNSDLYTSAVDAWYQPQYNVTQLITSGSCSTANPCLWVPWYGSSSSCIALGENESGNLKTGSSCDSGEPINATNNCMVSDEFSQVGLDLSMGQNQSRFQHFHNTVNVINSSRAKIPAWRVYRSGNTIETCRTNINGNCDTASDATARIIIAHWNAANNTFFTNQSQKNNYAGLALNLSVAMVQSELTFSCKNSTLGSGLICWWLRAGNQSSLTATDGGYTGYSADAEIAFLQTCSQTGNLTYCAIAGNISLNYKQAAKWNGTAFRAPPGRSYKWDNFSSASVPYANCTNTCGDSAIDGDETWDASDAIRAFFEGTANYYDRFLLGTNVLPNSTTYMAQWVAEKMIGNLNSLPIQYYPNGNNSGSNQSGYVAQAMQAAGIISQNNATQVNTTVWNAMNHYTHSTHKWDSAACPGVYNSAFPIRMLGVGMGRDAASFGPLANGSGSNGSNNTAPIVTLVNITPQPLVDSDDPRGRCTVVDNQSTNLTCYYAWFKNGAYQFEGNEACLNNTDNLLSVYDHASSNQSETLTFSCRVQDGSLNSSWVNSTNRTIGTPVVNLSRINSTTNTVTGNLSLTCGGYDAESDRVSYNYLVFRNGTLNGTGTIIPPGGMCYQETADVGTACGGRSGGSYSSTAANWVNMAAVSDGNASTGSTNTGSTANLYVLYEAPPNVSLNTSYWQVTDAEGTRNISMAGCSAHEGYVQFVVLSRTSVPGFIWFYCYDGASYLQSYEASLGNGTVFEEGMWWNISSEVNASVNVLNITTGLVKGQNWTLSCMANDSYTASSYLNSSVFTVLNSLPNASNIQIQNISGAANCTYLYTDADGDVENGTGFRWFKNNTLLASTSRNLTSGNYSVGDQLKCEVKPSDAEQNGTAQNSSSYVVGDLQVPVINSFSVPSSGTTSDSLTITANCTDANSLADGFPKVQWTNPNGIIDANVSLASAGGNLYAVAYTFNTVGTYRNFTLYCQDGSGNIATNLSSAALSISAGATVPGGSGGGGGGGQVVTIIKGDHCDFSIVRPTNGFVNTLCPTGRQSGRFSFVLQNEEGTTRTYTTSFHNVQCQIDTPTFSVAGKAQHESVITNCQCPTNTSIEGSINITSDVCTGQLPIKLYNGIFSRLLFDQDTLIKFLVVAFIIMIITLGILFLTA